MNAGSVNVVFWGRHDDCTDRCILCGPPLYLRSGARAPRSHTYTTMPGGSGGPTLDSRVHHRAFVAVIAAFMLDGWWRSPMNSGPGRTRRTCTGKRSSRPNDVAVHRKPSQGIERIRQALNSHMTYVLPVPHQLLSNVPHGVVQFRATAWIVAGHVPDPASHLRQSGLHRRISETEQRIVAEDATCASPQSGRAQPLFP